jgi:poly(3-hydroxybutyrate) depolymerase
VKGTSREYALELPTGYDGKTPAPVMFAFHGTTTDGQKFLGPGYGDVRNGAAGRLILVAPNGLGRTGGDTGWLDTSGRGSEINQEDVDFFDALIALLKADYCVDTRRIFAIGHSAGGLMSNYLGCIRGDIVRAIGPFSGWGPTRSAMGRTISAQCVGSVAAFVGHNPREGDPDECAKLSGGKCPWIVDWETLGWPTVEYWTSEDSCGDIGAMPTAAFDGNSTTGDPLPCKSFAGCDANDPVMLCLYDYSNQNIGPHAFPTQWGAKAVTDFFLGLPKVP